MCEPDVKLSAGVDFCCAEGDDEDGDAVSFQHGCQGNVSEDPVCFTCPGTDACWECC